MFVKKNICEDGIASVAARGLGEYDLAATMECGQCFRYERVEREDGAVEYMTVIGDIIVRVIQRERGELIFRGISDEDFERVIRPYFSLDRDLAKVRDEIVGLTDSEWLKDAAAISGGIAILKQDPWETLISFIISQNNNIPRIRKIVREICGEYGVNLYLQQPEHDKCPLGIISTTPCEENCKKCKKCLDDVCMFNAISFKNNKITIDNEHCKCCGLCVNVCKFNAISISYTDKTIDNVVNRIEDLIEIKEL